MKRIKRLWTTLLEIFDDRLTKAAGVVCLLIILIVIFNMRTSLADAYPLLGTLVFGLVPILFIVGGIIFIMAILKFSERGEKNGPS